MPASDQHREYTANIAAWNKVRASVNNKVKEGKTLYLPQPNPQDTSKDNQDRYNQYVFRANYVNFAGMTLEGLMGMVFRKELTVKLPSALAYLEFNADGAGLSLQQISRKTVSDVTQLGRDGLLVDYPEAQQGLSSAQVDEMQLRANIVHYAAESVSNWRTTVIGGVTVLSMVVLDEKVEEYSADGFSSEVKDYKRVLSLDVDEGSHIYVQALYNEKDEIVSSSQPKQVNGSSWDRIPFVFVGSENNGPAVDKSPLLDITNIGLSHYQNSADFEDSSYTVGQPTPVFSGLTQTWVDKNYKNGITLGSKAAVFLPSDGSAQLLQSDPNILPKTGMEMKEAQIVKLGARIIQDSSGVETAEAARIRYAGQNSKLAVIVGNVEEAFLKCFEWAAMFMGGEGETVYELNREYYEKTIDPQLIMAQIALLDRGIIATVDLQDNLRDHGIISSERSNEDIASDAEITDEIEP